MRKSSSSRKIRRRAHYFVCTWREEKLSAKWGRPNFPSNAIRGKVSNPLLYAITTVNGQPGRLSKQPFSPTLLLCEGSPAAADPRSDTSPFPYFMCHGEFPPGDYCRVWGNSGSEGRGGGAGAFNPLPSALSNGHKFMIGRKERGNGGLGAYLETEAAMNASIARRHNLGREIGRACWAIQFHSA